MSDDEHGSPSNLRVDYRSAPDDLALDRTPRFSWTVDDPEWGGGQSAYRLRLDPSPERLAEGSALWDSGRVESERSTAVAYDGPPLSADRTYHWTVTVWNDEGERSAPADPASFTTGLDGVWSGELMRDCREWATPTATGAGGATRRRTRSSGSRSTRGRTDRSRRSNSVESRWEATAGGHELTVRIPWNAEGRVAVPLADDAATVAVDGATVWSEGGDATGDAPAGVASAEPTGDRLALDVEPGTYVVTVE